MKNNLYKTILFTLALLLFASCDSNDPVEEEETFLGSVDIEITGDLMQTITSNLATFGAATDPETGITGFALTLGANTGNSSAGLSFIRQSGRPGTGAHTIANIGQGTDFETINSNHIIGIFSTGTDVFYSSGGTMNLTRSTDTRLEGTLTLTARSVLPGSTDEITITGSFKANGQDLSN